MRSKSFGPAALSLSLLAAALFAAPSSAFANLVQNGSMSQSSYTENNQFGTVYGGQGLTDWTANGGYLLYMYASTATTKSAQSEFSNYGSGQQMLWGPLNNPSTFSIPPNFVVMDGGPSTVPHASITQTIAGLVVNQKYELKFDWGAGQLQSEQGDTQTSLAVSLGSQTINTATEDNASKSFYGWSQVTMTFTASATSEALTFLANGTPVGYPPVAVLGAISLVKAPEPVSVALLAVGLGGLAWARRRHLQRG